MARNFIQNKADVTQYYINRAKKEEEKNQFKVVDTRRVRVPSRHKQSVINQQSKPDAFIERPIQREPSPPIQTPPPPPPPLPSTQSSKSQSSILSPSNPPAPGTPDYRFLLAWSYYLATQATWLSPMIRQQQGQSPLSLPTDPEAAAKFLQAMQTVMNPLTTSPKSNNNNHEQTENELDSDSNTIHEEANEL
jgi:hypothetical protein